MRDIHGSFEGMFGEPDDDAYGLGLNRDWSDGDGEGA